MFVSPPMKKDFGSNRRRTFPLVDKTFSLNEAKHGEPFHRVFLGGGSLRGQQQAQFCTRTSFRTIWFQFLFGTAMSETVSVLLRCLDLHVSRHLVHTLCCHRFTQEGAVGGCRSQQ